MVEETNGEMDNGGKKGMERCVSVCVYGGGGVLHGCNSFLTSWNTDQGQGLKDSMGRGHATSIVTSQSA